MRVVQVKTPEREGYSALQVTWGVRRAATLNKPEQGHFATAGVEPGRHLVELRIDDASGFEVGQQLTADVHEPPVSGSTPSPCPRARASPGP